MLTGVERDLAEHQACTGSLPESVIQARTAPAGPSAVERDADTLQQVWDLCELDSRKLATWAKYGAGRRWDMSEKYKSAKVIYAML